MLHPERTGVVSQSSSQFCHSEYRRSMAEIENWPAWYAEYMVREQAGTELPT